MTAKDYLFKRKYRDQLRSVILKLTANPTSSESVSTPNGGSRSVSYTSLASLQAELRTIEHELDDFWRAYGCSDGVSVNYARYC